MFSMYYKVREDIKTIPTSCNFSVKTNPSEKIIPTSLGIVWQKMNNSISNMYVDWYI